MHTGSGNTNSYRCSDEPEQERSSTPGEALQIRNPLLCSICNDYYTEPCILDCYHSYCARCLRGRIIDNKISCPICGQSTALKDHAILPPHDILMRNLVELANSENPPCANCDKRDKTSMYFCITCGQALCTRCRENTHRAKMFSAHEILHMSQYPRDNFKRCSKHGEQFVMFSTTQRNMMCITCFRETPQESRQNCVDIDTAYAQYSKKLDRTVTSVCEAQSSVREGIHTCRNLLEELRQNTDSEKMTIHSFCQGMQESIMKTQTSMNLEVQRQYESKERIFRNQLVTLSSILPVLQLHILLSRNFATSANKFQFLELSQAMFDRLSSVAQIPQPLRPIQSSQIRTNFRSEFAHCLEPWIGKLMLTHQQPPTSYLKETAHIYESSQNLQQNPPASQSTQSIQSTTPNKKQSSALKAKALEGEGPFSNHCRTFDTQIKELGCQLSNVRERLGDLHRDVTTLRRAAMPPLVLRHENISRDCARLNDTLEHNQVELERLRSVFQTLWQEQLCRIHVEQEIFHSQMNDITKLRAEVKQMAVVAQQLEPYVKQFSVQNNLNDLANLQALIEKINLLQGNQSDQRSHWRSDQTAAIKTIDDNLNLGTCMSMSASNENFLHLKDEMNKCEEPVRESHSGRDIPLLDSLLTYGSRGQVRGVLSQLIDKVRTKEERKGDRKKSPVQEDTVNRERSRSEGRGAECLKDCMSVQRPKLLTPGKMEKESSKNSSSFHQFSSKVGSARDRSHSDISMLCSELVKTEASAQKKLQENEQNNANTRSQCDIPKQQEPRLKSRSKETKRQPQTHAKSPTSFKPPMDADDDDDYGPISRDIILSKAMIHTPPRSKTRAHSDTEDCVFYPEISSSGRSSMDLADGRKTFFVVINAKNKSSGLMRKQRSWDTFPPKKRCHEISMASKFCRDPDSFQGGFNLNSIRSEGLKKADSFEGHEEAVRTLVAAVQETRTLRKPKPPSSNTA
ncbi:RING finger protein 207 isoform X2 [Bemisia tabaci]|uniref:RING finger protein 207 isoform X2 n=1 Tax=Bemisia tabaci TaxID=7038 RepID=UPI0008F99B5A|nr:PREDICTED: RING finger protein 207-like isoform X2 [Bemisia tabaci]